MCLCVQQLNLIPVQVKMMPAILGSEANLSFVSQATIPECCQGAAPSGFEGELLRRLPKLRKRMRKMCLTFMKESPLPRLVEGLDQFTGGCQRPGQGWIFLSVFPSGTGGLRMWHLCSFLISCVVLNT